jgi:signal transduction histidine kinase/ActR/RegA family two-component response regulator
LNGSGGRGGIRAGLDDRPQRWFLMPLVVLALGLLSIGLLVVTNWIRERVVVQDTALHRAVGEIQTRLSTAHLWLEEHVAGDQVDLEEISSSLDRADALLAVMVAGGQAGPYRLAAVSDPDLLARVEAVAPQVERFRGLSEERERGFRLGEEVGIGSPIDTEYDRIYNRLIDDLQRLDAVVALRLDRSHSRSQLLFRTILVAWVVIVALAVTGLSRLEIRRRRTHLALLESEAQLRQAQKMEAVGRLAGGMAHDINNYLAAITAQCELVEMTSEPGSTLARRMNRVVATTAKAAALIERLLSFSRRKPVQPEIMNLNRAVEDLQEMLGRLIGEDVQMQTRLAPDLWNVEIDPSQIEQVILNLTVNAREAMPTGGRLVIETSNQRLRGNYLETLPVENEGDYVMLSVSDTGVGVARDLQDKIFEPFMTTKDKTRQSGLGLAMVYAISTQNGGGVSVYSTEGHGATFKVYLPRTRAIPLAHGAADEEPPPAPRGTERLLLVEDNAELREAVSEALRSLGYLVEVAADAETALDLDERLGEPPELLITDVVLPGMNGRELWSLLWDRHPHLEVIFLSGYTDDIVLQHGVEEGEYRFVQKPFSIEVLAATVAEVFSELSAAGGDARA